MRRLGTALLLAILALPLTAVPALAHERRTVGPYQLVVGWLGEPAFTGQMNAIDLTVTDTTKSNAPVEGLDKTLHAEITYGGLGTSLAVTFRARFGLPGKYAADVMPTKDGTYTFHIFGKVGSLDLDERFESGPGRFNDVQKLTALQYPDAVPNGADILDRFAAVQSEVDQARVLAVAALVLAIALPLGVLSLGRRSSR